jgi:hypothetical protein
MRWLAYLGFVAALLVSPHALATGQLDCENAAYAQYKKQTDERDAKRLRNLSKPITVQEVLADRRMLEAYCVKHAAGAGKPQMLGQNFSDCLDQDAAERVREMDELHSNTRDR